MPLEFPPEDEPLDPAWWAPLIGVARAIAGEPRYRFFELDDFMLMAKVIRKPRPSVTLYKHYYLRRYLNLDDAGHAYRYIAPRSLDSGRSGQYRAHHDVREALDHLELWGLPWMKPGLEEFRCGLAWEDRILLHPDYAKWVEEEEALSNRRRLRAV